MIEMHSKYDNMHINGIFYALFCINKHVFHVKIACYQWIPEEEQGDSLGTCHSSTCGGHFATRKTADKILQSGFY